MLCLPCACRAAGLPGAHSLGAAACAGARHEETPLLESGLHETALSCAAARPHQRCCRCRSLYCTFFGGHHVAYPLYVLAWSCSAAPWAASVQFICVSKKKSHLRY